MAKSIANLNIAITSQRAAGAEPNSLLDQREEAVRKLSELASVQVVKQDDGALSVFVGNGEPLVIGASANKFEVRDGGKIYLLTNIGSVEITDQISGGQLSGLMNFKGDVLTSSLNQLGRVALVMSDSFNTLQAQGLDANGNYGKALFSDINDSDFIYSRVQHGKNALPDDRQIYVTIEDPNQLTASDYLFSIVPNTSNYTVTRESDNTIIGQGVLSGAYPTEITFDGVSVHLQSGSFQGGDTFTLQPTRGAAREIHSTIGQPANLAFAVPIRSATASGNIGTGIVSSGEILSLVDESNNVLPSFAVAGKMSPPVVIRFTSETTYEVLDNTDPARPIPLTPRMSEQTFIPNRSNAIFATDKGETRSSGSGAIVGLPVGRPPATLFAANPMQANGYPAETYTFTTTDPLTGSVTSQSMTSITNASAAQTAAQLSNVPGISAHAFTTATISNVNITPAAFSSPLQLSVNGEDLLAYTGGVLDASVPNPTASQSVFNDYLATKINTNANLRALGIRAQSSSNAITGAPELNLVAASGVNVDIRLNATNASANSISVNDGSGNPNVVLNGVNSGLNEQSATTVGGKIDITLANGMVLNTTPGVSQLLGDSTVLNFARSAYLGYQVNISGQPKTGDVFTVNFNTNSKNDNRNALALANLETTATLQNGSMSFGQGYGRLVEEVATKSNLSKVNTEASKSLLEQTTAMRDGVSGVNLDEEAANLILFQQMYTANARVISVAKDLFDTLVNSLG